MKLRAVAACLALTLFGQSAHSATLFDLFQTMCVKSAADPAKAIETANALKWGDSPPRIVTFLTKPSDPGEVITEVTSKVSADPKGILAMAVAQTNHMVVQKEIPAKACVILATPLMDVGGISAEAASYAAVSAQSGLVSQKSAVSYLWRESGDGKHSPVAMEEIAAGNPGSDTRLLVVMADETNRAIVLQFFVPISGN